MTAILQTVFRHVLRSKMLVMLVVFGLTPPLIVLSLTRLVRSKPATATHMAIPMLRHALLNSFVPKFWFMKPWQMCESVGFAVAVTVAPTEPQKLWFGLGVSAVCTIPTLVSQQYNDNLEQNTDRIARVGTIITMTIGAFKAVLSTTVDSSIAGEVFAFLVKGIEDPVPNVRFSAGSVLPERRRAGGGDAAGTCQ